MFRRHDNLRPPGELAIRCTREGHRHVVAPAGELDLTSAVQLEEALRRAEATDASEILIDLGGLEFIDSIGLSVLLQAHRRTQFHHKRLMILRGSDSIQQRFEVTGMTSRLPFVDHEAVALPPAAGA